MPNASVVRVGTKRCRPFVLNVMVMSPEAGFKFEVDIEKGCTAENDATWKLVFDLYKKIDSDFVQIVHVSFTADAPNEVAGVRRIASEGVSLPQSDVLSDEVFPVAKQLDGVDTPSSEQKDQLTKAMRKVTTVEG